MFATLTFDIRSRFVRSLGLLSNSNQVRGCLSLTRLFDTSV